MVDNSLGRYWIERHPESGLAEKLDFLVKPKTGKFQTVNETVTPQDMSFFDPCMGSGHILAYAFDVLMEIYREYGYTDREAVAEIMQNNLYGFDIDERCTQLAYFVVIMKARQYDARFFKRGIYPQVYYPKMDQELKAYGSLLRVDTLEAQPKEPAVFTLFDMDYDIRLNDWNCRRLLYQKYTVVCTNPPYLNKYNDKLKKFVTENYKDYSGDLFSVFIYRNFGFCKKEGYSAFMTPFVWMFIKTYEKLREYIINSKSITSLIQMEYSAFEEATVPICSFVLQNCKSEDKSLCFRLSDFKGGMEVQKEKVLEAIKNPDCGYFYEAQQSNFSKIPGSPVAYWASQNLLKAFDFGTLLGKIALARNGLKTGKNEEFVRLWWEIYENSADFHSTTLKDAISANKKWYPYNKGGEYRKWYGNDDCVLLWQNAGERVISGAKAEGRHVQDYPNEYKFSPIVTWSLITSAKQSFRFKNNCISDIAGMSLYNSKQYCYYLLGLCNSKVAEEFLKIFSPTINCQAGDIASIPVYKEKNNVEVVDPVVKRCVEVSSWDWDSFETSWNFVKHSLIRQKDSMKFTVTDGDSKTKSYFLHGAYRAWENECDDRFNQLKANEEELNRIFIDIYGLQDELTPEVEDKDVTVRKADLQRDIKSLISYAVGCMFGRYSLDVDGLAYAGGEWDDSKYTTYPADKDNIIPICDDEYFDDDMVGRFVKFIETVYGSDTLEENLKFIADALGGKGQPREVIRNYFLNDFYIDHCKIYQKRPIYWLFDSGKKNGFKALVYMHRYQPDTIARIRTDHVHEQQSRYRTAIADMENRIANVSTSERVKLNKALNRLKDQDTELRTYEEKIHHLADQMIAIDLDDGVKVNYAKFQDVLAKIK